MKTHRIHPLYTILRKGTAPSLLLTLVFSLSSCNNEDPSYEKEALKLTAEKASLEARLDESERKLATMESQLSQAQSAVRSATEKVSDAKEQISDAKGKIDVDKIKLGFAKAVSDLGEQIETKHPDYNVESVTFQKMKLPTDYPFSSGVMTTLVSKSTGAKQILYWEAQGNTQGAWRFANKKKPTTAVVPSPNIAGNTPAPSAQPVPARPAPSQPTRATRTPTRRPTRADGNSHIIDWGNLK